MSRAKTRNFLVTCHLLLAGLLAPLFILVAITGGLYLIGEKGEVVETALSVPEGTTLDADAPTIEADVRAVLAANDLPTDFEYLRMRPGSITTRPTTEDFVVLEQGDDGWSATLNEPNFLYRMIELHKGHGPQLFKTYQIGAAISLFMVVLGGLLVGLLAPAYRKQTIGASAFGTAAFALLAFVI
ncbi:hypothetical protein [Qipengyuania sp. DGS5-3]|uniref:hypothetical protein n=1 Tax=Qipengyuania sp. DGS5-3 TaxID=3349632 RepID=UPI0036D31F24